MRQYFRWSDRGIDRRHLIWSNLKSRSQHRPLSVTFNHHVLQSPLRYDLLNPSSLLLSHCHCLLWSLITCHMDSCKTSVHTSNHLLTSTKSVSFLFITVVLRYDWYTKNSTYLMHTIWWIWRHAYTRDTITTIKVISICVTSKSWSLCLFFSFCSKNATWDLP